MSLVNQRIMQTQGLTLKTCVRGSNYTFVLGKMETRISRKRSLHYLYNREDRCVNGYVVWAYQTDIVPILTR